MAIVNAKIKIGDGLIQDMEKDYGFYLSSSDKLLSAPVRDYETQQYPEKSGAKIDGRTTLQEFDYKTGFIYFSDTIYNANKVITNFYNSLFTAVPNSDIKIAKQITLYNDYMGVTIVGYPKSIPPLARFYRDRKDVVEFELIIFVNDPEKCIWNK